MADYTIISDVSQHMVKILREKMCPEPIPSPNNITASSPSEQDVDYILGLYLYDIEKGEVVSIIGSSGSGKTTLLRCINFLELADTGVMTLDGNVLFDSKTSNNLKDKQLREARLNFGLVFQQFNLFPQYNVLDNVMLAPRLLLEEKVLAYKNELKFKGIHSLKQYLFSTLCSSTTTSKPLYTI